MNELIRFLLELILGSIAIYYIVKTKSLQKKAAQMFNTILLLRDNKVDIVERADGSIVVIKKDDEE